MEIVEANRYRVRKNRLYLPSLGPEAIRVPFGTGLGIRRRKSGKAGADGSTVIRPRLRLLVRGGKVVALDAQTERGWIRLLPVFSRTIARSRAGTPALRIQMATSDEERLAAVGVVKRAHYLDARGGGVILLAYFSDLRESRKIRARWWNRLTPTEKARYRALEKATGGETRIVGALHLERLMHGNPLGRTAIYRHADERPPDARARSRSGLRWKVVSELGLYWISRVAVDAPFRGLGIGSALCDAAREVAATKMLERGRFIELIRRMPIAEFDAISAGRGDFLTGCSRMFSVDLPFTLRTPFLSRKPPRSWNAARGRWERRMAEDLARPAGDCLAYYYAEAGPMVIGVRTRRRARQGARR
jgi:GNAT superfamily N-acetyltransferase